MATDKPVLTSPLQTGLRSPPERPPLVGAPLDEELLNFFRDDTQLPSEQEWHRRLQEVGGRRAAVPLGRLIRSGTSWCSSRQRA